MMNRTNRINLLSNVKHIKNPLLQFACKNINLCIIGEDNVNNCFSHAIENRFIKYQDIGLQYYFLEDFI